MVNYIPAQHAEIFWNVDGEGNPTDDVLVCDRRSRSIGKDGHVVMGSRFRMSCGAMNASWMKSDNRDDTPEGVFASFWLASHARPTFGALQRALVEFGKIDSCEWARQMARAVKFDRNYGVQGEES